MLTFQYGNVITNSIIPISEALMRYLAVAGIPYERWGKFIWKLVVIALVALVIAVMIGVSNIQ